MKKWTKLTRCDDLAYLHPVLRAKVPALLADVQGHFDPKAVQFRVFETGRSYARQVQLVAQGVSKTLHSQHLVGRAVDIIPFVFRGGTWQPTWEALLGKEGRSWTDLLTSSATAHDLDRVYFTGPHGSYPDGPHVQLQPAVSDTCEGW